MCTHTPCEHPVCTHSLRAPRGTVCTHSLRAPRGTVCTLSLRAPRLLVDPLHLPCGNSGFSSRLTVDVCLGAPMLLDRCDYPHRPYLLSHTNRWRGGGSKEYLRVYCSGSTVQERHTGHSSDCNADEKNVILLLSGA